MVWMPLALISLITLSLGSLAERLLMKSDQSEPVGYAIVFQFLMGLMSLIIALGFGRFIWPQNIQTFILFILPSFLWAGSTVFSFFSMKTLNAAEAVIIGSSGSLLTMILAVTFLGDQFSIKLLLGIILIISAVFLIYAQAANFKSRQGIICALLSAACAAVAVIFDTVILKTYDAFSYTALMSFLPGIVLLILFPRRSRSVVELSRSRLLPVMLIFVFLYSIQAITYYLALQSGAPVSQLSPLMKLSIILTVFLGAVFLKERQYLMRKILAGLLMLLGATLLG